MGLFTGFRKNRLPVLSADFQNYEERIVIDFDENFFTAFMSLYVNFFLCTKKTIDKLLNKYPLKYKIFKPKFFTGIFKLTTEYSVLHPKYRYTTLMLYVWIIFNFFYILGQLF